MANPQDELDVLRTQVSGLTARMYRLEQRTGIEPQAAAPPPPRPSATPGPTPPPPMQRPSVPPPSLAAPPRRQGDKLEGRIGKVWINRIGIVAMLVGVAYFLKLAFDSKWIGPTGQVAIGVVAGIAVVVWSELFRRKGSAIFSYSLKAVGIGILYLSFWAAFKFYDPALISASTAFILMALLTAFTIV